jgi:hypothetical protein
MKVGQHDVGDPTSMGIGEGNVLIDVALRIDHGRHARLFISDQVRRVGETIEIELFQDHELVV